MIQPFIYVLYITPQCAGILLSFKNIKFQKCVINMKTLRNLITTHSAPFLGTTITYSLKCFKIYGTTSSEVFVLVWKFQQTRNIYLPAWISHIYVWLPLKFILFEFLRRGDCLYIKNLMNSCTEQTICEIWFNTECIYRYWMSSYFQM